MKRSSKKPAGLRKTVRDIRKGKRSMQTFVWIYFVLFAIVILVVLWLGQYVFLYNYYRSAKVSNISREANRIIQAYGTEEQGHINRTVAYENSMCIVITDTDGNPLTSENNLGSYSKLYDDIEHNYSMYIFELKSALEKEKDNCYTVTFDNDDLNVKEMIYCAKVYTDDSEDQAYLFIESTIEPIDSTVKIIREQLMFISIILFELAIIVGTLAAMRLSRPIVSITKTAKRFGEGDFDVEFKGKGYKETEKLAEVLNDAKNEIRKVSDLRKDLIANISHDLRTPLTMVKAYAEMIRDLSGDNPVKRAEHVQVIIDEADRLSNLVNNLLELSKLESGNMELNRRKFSIVDKINDCMTRYQLVIEQNGYDMKYEPDEDRQIDADPDKLDQVIYNFINNAINYTGDHKVIRIKQINSEKSVRIEVSDNGKGIAKELLPKVFDRYYRDAKVKRDVVGTGLGLAICKEILKCHDFPFGVRSEEGKGTTFWFEIPT
ncbi:MAG: HAMP domain-containing histidine kinase [Ruminococcus sp.]|uniref:sensor histidine kinase n=1 Tax=Ruminococcus sp. TaxID=41978 RepID=UPI0025F0B1A1|nr:HAMP domain-containing sensor histidine kinase [Ruminococcus sp.]MCR5540760.1 HAMP domain-containing histidine kinase [Ruminococcus sp.]